MLAYPGSIYFDERKQGNKPTKKNDNKLKQTVILVLKVQFGNNTLRIFYDWYITLFVDDFPSC